MVRESVGEYLRFQYRQAARSARRGVPVVWGLFGDGQEMDQSMSEFAQHGGLPLRHSVNDRCFLCRQSATRQGHSFGWFTHRSARRPNARTRSDRRRRQSRRVVRELHHPHRTAESTGTRSGWTVYRDRRSRSCLARANLSAARTSHRLLTLQEGSFPRPRHVGQVEQSK
jgi:hypothetical protein